MACVAAACIFTQGASGDTPSGGLRGTLREPLGVVPASGIPGLNFHCRFSRMISAHASPR
eukprot:CAMPEP_0204319496 /NCGR_PEP_ID=MMETSP0469-20131031/7133_1 /ASSEMBLY_ACC=CAM_ASM_000384 /TAXON_ID=2969 /ORGANISM="Oxyrrhis marina" /LENGTH=59 /DNA_ID=CAMNT_0051300679 /DNA_START=66 /DNA_END=241 /DNA_ORIENTATION=-